MAPMQLPLAGEPARLADFDDQALAAELVRRTATPPGRAERIAQRALGLAFAADRYGDSEWTAARMSAAKIGRWAQPVLLQLSPLPSLELIEFAPSDDGTLRLLFRCRDGATIESVLIPAELGRDRGRMTLCISSQVGCARACTFCETGRIGLERQLSAAEIIDQYRLAARICAGAERPFDRRATAPQPPTRSDQPGRRHSQVMQPISNIVFMGMGEPFDNLSAVSRAVRLLSLQRAFSFAPTRITVSTVGVADKLADFFAHTRAGLAISLNAPDDERRSRIMPINRRHDLAALRQALLAALPANRRVLFQYALFADLNDSLADADLLASYVADIPCRVNVIPANPGPDPSLVAPDPARTDAFVARLKSAGVVALVRRPRGRDVGGACGQLAGSYRALQRVNGCDGGLI